MYWWFDLPIPFRSRKVWYVSGETQIAFLSVHIPPISIIDAIIITASIVMIASRNQQSFSSSVKFISPSWSALFYYFFPFPVLLFYGPGRGYLRIWVPHWWYTSMLVEMFFYPSHRVHIYLGPVWVPFFSVPVIAPVFRYVMLSYLLCVPSKGAIETFFILRVLSPPYDRYWRQAQSPRAASRPQ